ncbi:hypothetical protein [Streptomyces profundus]|uniref:hypothetical protein n=1 Tax=Streptomyces profundus TaxID=2867410 RepID=UPI001D16F7DF|nr:hypothetical protein [Streptomyces sp. MA3_2.13]UED84681.1 hypothetical protein K4G22_11070 [Streptomyces sp. MA3_2.13]
MLITLTADGRELADGAVAGHLALETRLLAELSDHDQRQLAGLLRQLLIGLGDHAPGDP